MPDALLTTVSRAIADRYVVERLVGSGGMASVFLARDRKHDRRVAIKVLNPELGALLGGERFLAEIRVTAALQHPNIVALHDSGEADGLLYFVMPYVDGESLRARLERERQLPVEDAVAIAIAIAGALEHAHRQGVIHRDLKPENILLGDGHPIVADFGIALAVSRAGGERLTQTRVSLGTPHYMSPEQAAADRTVDARSDIYSLGCLLYEMLAGEPPFTGSTVPAVIAKVMTDPAPSVRVLRPATPEHVAAAIDRALAKIPADRFPSARAFADALRGGTDGGRAVATPGKARRRNAVPFALGGGVIVAATLAAIWVAASTGREMEADATPTRFVIGPLTDPTLAGLVSDLTITPDGRHVVYRDPTDPAHRLLVRPLDRLEGRHLAGTENAFSPVVSPDSRWIAYFTGDEKLRKIPIDGGASSPVTGAFRFSKPRWALGDVIIFSSYGRRGGLTFVSPSGGAARHLTLEDSSRGETRHVTPLVVGNGRTIVFTAIKGRAGPGVTSGELAAAELDTTAVNGVPHVPLGIEGRAPVAHVDGLLVYVGRDGSSLMAVPFDARRRAVTGSPIAVLEDETGGIESADLAANGTLVYSRRRRQNRPMLVDSRGATSEPLSAASNELFMNPRFSPDGRQVAIQLTSGAGNDVVVIDVESKTRTQVTSTGNAIGPAWSSDGRSIVYMRPRSVQDELRIQPVDGSGPGRPVYSGPGIFGVAPAADGRHVVFQQPVNGIWGIWAVDLTASGGASPVVVDGFDNYMPAVSPDNRWLAYASNRSGRYQIYVRPFLRDGVPVQVSQDGGIEPVWSRDSRRIFYRDGRAIIAATLVASPSPNVLRRDSLFADSFAGSMPHVNFDVSPDGQRFVLVASHGTPSLEAVVVVNWLTELRQRLARR